MEEYLLKTILWGNPLINYIYFLSWILTALFIIFVLQKAILSRFKKVIKKTETKSDDVVFAFIEDSLGFVIVISAVFFGKSYLTLSADLNLIINRILFVIIILIGAHVINRFLQNIIKYIVKPFILKTETKLDDQLLPIFTTSSKAIVWTLAFLIIVSNMGYDFTSIIAGLGIGGLAVALAAQQTLGNLFASIAIFSDQPFQIGDLVKIEGTLGSITQVGFRSTRIKTIQGTEVVIPNSKVAEVVIENVTKRPTVRVDSKVGLVYGTSSKKLEKAVDIIRNIIQKEKDVEDDSYVTFAEFDDSSLNIEITYWIHVLKKWDNVLKVKHRINMNIKKDLEKEEVEFAFPTRHVILKKVS